MCLGALTANYAAGGVRILSAATCHPNPRSQCELHTANHAPLAAVLLVGHHGRSRCQRRRKPRWQCQWAWRQDVSLHVCYSTRTSYLLNFNVIVPVLRVLLVLDLPKARQAAGNTASSKCQCWHQCQFEVACDARSAHDAATAGSSASRRCSGWHH